MIYTIKKYQLKVYELKFWIGLRWLKLRFGWVTYKGRNKHSEVSRQLGDCNIFCKHSDTWKY